MRTSTLSRLTLAGLAALALTACSGGEVECVDGPGPAPDALCAPADAPADTALTLRARDDCGGCLYQATGCTVTRSGSVLTLSMTGDVCTLPDDYACPAVCSIDEVSCQTEPLPAGTYTVQGLAAGTSSAAVTIEVGAGTDTDCTL